MKEFKLGDICEVLTGFAFKSNLFNKEGKGIPLIRIRDLSTGASETYYSGKFEEKYLVRKGDFLIGMDGEFKIFEWKSEDALLNQRVCKLILNKSLVFPKYIYYIISKELKEIEDKTPFVTVKHISNKQILSINLNLPSIDTQKHIVSILEKAESLKRNRGDADKLTKDYLQSVFYEMFYNKGFVEVELGTICYFNPKKSEITDVDESLEVSFVPMADVQEHQIYFDLKDKKEIKEVYTGYTYFKENDVLLAKVTPCFENGKSGIAKNLKNKIGFGSSEFFILRASNKILPQLIYYYISSDKFINAGKKQMSGTGGLRRLSKSYVAEYKIPLPPLPLQNKFASIVERVEKLKEKQKQSKEEINQLFDSLMKKAFNGELIR